MALLSIILTVAHMHLYPKSPTRPMAQQSLWGDNQVVNQTSAPIQLDEADSGRCFMIGRLERWGHSIFAKSTEQATILQAQGSLYIPFAGTLTLGRGCDLRSESATGFPPGGAYGLVL